MTDSLFIAESLQDDVEQELAALIASGTDIVDPVQSYVEQETGYYPEDDGQPNAVSISPSKSPFLPTVESMDKLNLDHGDETEELEEESEIDLTSSSNVNRQKVTLLVDRSGGGHVFKLKIDAELNTLGMLTGTESDVEQWRVTRGIKDFGVVVHRNRLYILGGFNTDENKHLDSVYCFDPMLNTWERKSNLNVARSKFACAIIFGKIHVMGGEKSDRKATAACEWYNTKTDFWSKGGMLPAARKYIDVSRQGNVLYITGGEQNKIGQRNMWIYERLGWRELDTDYPQEISKRVAKHCTAYVGGTIYIMGGLVYSEPSEDDPKPTGSCQSHMESFKPKVFTANVQDLTNPDLICPWEWNLPNLPRPRHSATTIEIGHNIYLIGGCEDNEGREGIYEVDCYDTIAEKWRCAFILPRGHCRNVTHATLTMPVEPPMPTTYLWEDSHAEESSSGDSEMNDLMMKWILW